MRAELLVSPKVPTTSSARATFASSDVRAAIAKALRQQYVPSAEIEDLTQEVLVKALALDEPPVTAAECVAVARKMATDLAVDRMRRRRQRGRFHAGLAEDPDNHAASDTPASDVPERIDQGRQIDFVQRAIAAELITARQVAILEAEMDGVPQSKIARRLRVAYQTVRNDLTQARATMRKSWAAYATATLAALLAVLTGVLRDRSRPTLATTDVPEPDLDHAITAPEPTPQETADALRRMALHACDMKDWDACFETFGRAAALDPAGESKPWVQKARREAFGHLDLKLP
jgi:RNA polymerase sigma factor (sigma-70 family)